MQDHFKHKFAAYIGQYQKSETAHRPGHRGAPTPAIEMVPGQQHCKYRPGNKTKQDFMVELPRPAEKFARKRPHPKSESALTAQDRRQ